MPRPRSEPMAPSEWKVMRIVWKLNHCASRDVCAEAERLYGWSPSTVKTLLRRLLEKGHLTATPVGNSFLYRPKRTALKALLGAADELLENVLEGMTGPVLAHMVKRSKLSPQELAALRAILDAHSEDPERKV